MIQGSSLEQKFSGITDVEAARARHGCTPMIAAEIPEKEKPFTKHSPNGEICFGEVFGNIC